MRAHGVTRCVLCPGSRNSPLVRTLSAMPEMECRGATDERSAGFLAIGWARQSRCPVAVCVTSGSALLNLHPAVAEAFYQQLPLLVISADRPAAWIGQQDGQTLPQPGVFGSLVRASISLPNSGTEEGPWHTNRLINEALLELTHRGKGPVHLNMPLGSDLAGTTAHPLLSPRIIQRTELGSMSGEEEQALLAQVNSLPRRLILLGQLPEGPSFPPELAGKNFALAGEHLSQGGVGIQTRPDALMAAYPHSAWTPDLLITFGGCLISKRLKQHLRSHPPREHWHISRDGSLADTFCCLTRCIEGDPAEFWELLAAFAEEGDPAYAQLWRQDAPVPRFPYSGMKLVGDLIASLPPDSVLHLGNSSAVRYAQLFPLPTKVQVECNRGVNGIEGSLSSALGFAAGDSRINILIIGDLSLFYDMNALWQGQPDRNMRILMLNNGGGGIFQTLPGTGHNPFVYAPHHNRAAAWAKECGFRVLTVANERQWHTALPLLTAPGTSPIFIEALTDAEADAALLQQYSTPQTV